LKKVILSEESSQISFKLRINFTTVPEQFQADNIKNLGITLNITAARKKNRIQITIHVISKPLTLFPKTAKVEFSSRDYTLLGNCFAVLKNEHFTSKEPATATRTLGYH